MTHDVSNSDQVDGLEDDVSLPPVNDRKTSEWIVVLAAAHLNYRLSYEAGQWLIHVPLPELDKAERELGAFEEERQAWDLHKTPIPKPWLPDGSSWSPAWVAGMLIALYAWIGPYSSTSALARGAAMDTDQFFRGEWWRAVTALTVHGGPGHLAGNVVSLLLFGYAVCQVFGGGLGWILILASGILGNAAAAGLYGPDHISVGASTACFGALGILCACQSIRNLRQFGFSVSVWSRAWLPIGAGFALLTLLGTGPQSDLSAHLFGFAGGLLLCIPFVWHHPPRLSPGRQQLLQLLALVILMTAWRLVLIATG